MNITTLLNLLNRMRRRHHITNRLLRSYGAIINNIIQDLRRPRHRQQRLRRLPNPNSNFLLGVNRQSRNISRTPIMYLLNAMLPTRRPSLPKTLLTSLPNRRPKPMTTIRKSSLQPNLARTHVIHNRNRITRSIRSIPTPSHMTNSRHSSQLKRAPSLSLRIRRIRPPSTLNHCLVITSMTIITTSLLIASKTRHPIPNTNRSSRASNIIITNRHRNTLRFRRNLQTRHVTLIKAISNSLHSSINNLMASITRIPLQFPINHQFSTKIQKVNMHQTILNSSQQ